MRSNEELLSSYPNAQTELFVLCMRHQTACMQSVAGNDTLVTQAHYMLCEARLVCNLYMFQQVNEMQEKKCESSTIGTCVARS